MDKPPGVSRRQPAAGLHEHVEDLVGRVGCGGEPLCQRRSVDELHRHEHAACERADLVDLDDMRVAEPGQCLRLADQAGMIILVQQFDRHPPLEPLVVRRIDRTHATLAELTQHRKVADPPRRETRQRPTRIHRLHARIRRRLTVSTQRRVDRSLIYKARVA